MRIEEWNEPEGKPKFFLRNIACIGWSDGKAETGDEHGTTGFKRTEYTGHLSRSRVMYLAEHPAC